MKSKYYIKRLLSIQAILIYFGIITLTISIYYKNKAARLFADYERETVKMILLNNSIGGAIQLTSIRSVIP